MLWVGRALEVLVTQRRTPSCMLYIALHWGTTVLNSEPYPEAL